MIRKVFKVIKKRELRNIVKSKQIYTFLINETIILVDGYKLTDKDGFDFTFIWVHDRQWRSTRRDQGWTEHETSPRGTGT